MTYKRIGGECLKIDGMIHIRFHIGRHVAVTEVVTNVVQRAFFAGASRLVECVEVVL